MNTETNFMSFENLTKLIEEHKKETHPYKRYEFDSTSYTLLLISINNLIKENQELKKQLDYLRSEEYYNQLRFERDMLQNVVDNGEVPKEDKQFIDMTHRNTVLLEQQKEFVNYLEDEKDRLIKETSHYYIDSFDRQHAVNETIYDEVNIILQKYKSIIGDDK